MAFRLILLGFRILEMSLYAVAWVRHVSRAPEWLCSGDVMNRVFCVLFIEVSSAASLSAFSFPSVPAWPFIHLNDVAPAHFLILFMIGLSMFAWFMFAKFSSMCFLLFTQRAFIAHSESVLIWIFAWLGECVSALYIASSSAVVFDCIRFRPTGSALLRGLLGLNQIPVPVRASVVPFEMQEPSVYTVMLGGDWDLGIRLAVSRDIFSGFVNILKLSYISPVVDMFWLKIFTFSGGPMAFSLAALMSSWVIDSLRRWSSSYGVYLGDMSCMYLEASLKHEFGWGHPAFRYLWQGLHLQWLFSLCGGFS